MNSSTKIDWAKRIKCARKCCTGKAIPVSVCNQSNIQEATETYRVGAKEYKRLAGKQRAKVIAIYWCPKYLIKIAEQIS